MTEEEEVMRCPICKNVLPPSRTTKYIAAHGLTEFYEWLCAFCDTKILSPVNQEGN